MQNDRDELADALAENAEVANTLEVEQAADVVSAAFWRKKPSRESLIRVVWERMFPGTLAVMDDFELASERHQVSAIADAILALMDGPTETGEK